MPDLRMRTLSAIVDAVFFSASLEVTIGDDSPKMTIIQVARVTGTRTCSPPTSTQALQTTTQSLMKYFNSRLQVRIE